MADDRDFIKEEGFHAIGKSDYLKFLDGKSLTMAQSIQANCYVCNNLDDGSDCGVPDCVFYKYHPHNTNRENWTKKQRKTKAETIQRDE